jgi:hypothetical protein
VHTRADLGPWVASCGFALAQLVPEKSPEAAIGIGKPVNDQLQGIAANAGVENPLDPRNKPGPSAASDRWCLNRLQPPGELQSVIVTLPDPIHSHLALDFDRRINAIQTAALQEGYVLDHFWLPWRGIRIPPSENPDLKTNDRVLQQLRLDEPGLEIYRSVSTNDVLFVFLVGETPTLGIKLAQLQKAVEYTREIRFASRAGGLSGPQGQQDSVRLLGPSFSGSIPALIEFLAHTTAEWKQNKDQSNFVIVTSSATDQSLLERLRKAVGRTSVNSVVHDDDVALHAFVSYAKDYLGVSENQIALISESDTGYGQDIRSLASQVASAENVRTFHFPNQIYRLRTVYPAAQQISAGQHPPEKIPTSGLDLDLKLNSGGEDGVPAFSKDELPLSQEAELLSVAEAIRRERIKLAGVAASDVFDALFVLRFLHEFCPDTRLFILDSDLMLVRAVDNLSLQGTLAVTDYPLSQGSFQVPAPPSWKESVRKPFSFSRFSPRRAEIGFPSRNAEITYNGFVAITGRPGLMNDYRLAGGTAGKDGPTLWLTVISRNGFQPVHVFADTRANAIDLQQLQVSANRVAGKTANLSSTSRSAISEATPLGAVDLPAGSNLGVAYALFAVTMMQFVCVWIGRNENAKYAIWLIEFFHVSDSEGATEKASFLSVSFLVLAVLNLFVFLPIWRSAYLAADPRAIASTNQSTIDWYSFLSGFGGAAVAGCLIVSMYLALRYRVFHKRAEACLLGIVLAVLVTYSGVWVWFLCFGPDSAYFLQRCLDLSNGTSPLLPHVLWLMVLYFWSIAQVRRVHLWDVRRQSIAFDSLDAAYQSGFRKLQENLNHYFERIVSVAPSLSALILACLAGVVVMSARPRAHLAGIEPFAVSIWGSRSINIFDGLYTCYALLCAVLIAAALLRFLLGWSALLNVLRRLERQPIRHAFDRLPKKFYSWTPLWHAGGARRSLAIQTRALECFDKLLSYRDAAGFPRPLAQHLQAAAENLKTATSQLLAAESRGKLNLSAENAKATNLFTSVADWITSELLLPHWQQTGNCESIEQHEKNQAEKPDKGVRHVFQEKNPPLNPHEFIVVAEEFVALRFVAFMRYVGVQLRNMLSFVVAGFVLCVASIRSYPFLTHRTIGWGLTVVFLVLGIPVVIAFAQMDRDAILSRLSDTDPGKLDRAFYVRLIAYGGLPFLTVLASQFPSIGSFLFSWVQPAIEALH